MRDRETEGMAQHSPFSILCFREISLVIEIDYVYSTLQYIQGYLHIGRSMKISTMFCTNTNHGKYSEHISTYYIHRVHNSNSYKKCESSLVNYVVSRVKGRLDVFTFVVFKSSIYSIFHMK